MITTQPLRVALLALHFADYTLRLALALRARGHEVLFVTYADHARNELGDAWEHKLATAGLRLLVLERPRHPGQILRNAWTLRSSLKRFGPDVVHAQETPRDELVLALLSLPRVPRVLTVHDPAPHPGVDSARMGLRRRLYRDWLRARSRLSIVHGESLRHALEHESPVLRGRVRIARHGPLGGPAADWPVSRKPMRFLFFGRVEAYKGLGYLVEAARRVVAQGHRLQVVVAGRGDDLERHRAAMQDAGCFVVHDRYIPADQVPELFNSCAIVVLPYVEASQSGVAAMALGYGRAVLATTVGEIPDMVRHETNGLLVPPADAEALTAAMVRLLEAPDAVQRMGQAAGALGRTELGWAAVAEATSLIYQEAIGATTSRPTSI